LPFAKREPDLGRRAAVHVDTIKDCNDRVAGGNLGDLPLIRK
jgi:hypothetical protein